MLLALGRKVQGRMLKQNDRSSRLYKAIDRMRLGRKFGGNREGLYDSAEAFRRTGCSSKTNIKSSEVNTKTSEQIVI